MLSVRLKNSNGMAFFRSQNKLLACTPPVRGRGGGTRPVLALAPLFLFFFAALFLFFAALLFFLCALHSSLLRLHARLKTEQRRDNGKGQYAQSNPTPAGPRASRIVNLGIVIIASIAPSTEATNKLLN